MKRTRQAGTVYWNDRHSQETSMKVLSRPQIPCDACVERLLGEIPAGTTGSAEFQVFSFCDHRGVMFCLKQTADGQQWATYSPATPALLEQHVELQRMVNAAQKKWFAANTTPEKLQ